MRSSLANLINLLGNNLNVFVLFFSKIWRLILPVCRNHVMQMCNCNMPRRRNTENFNYPILCIKSINCLFHNAIMQELFFFSMLVLCWIIFALKNTKYVPKKNFITHMRIYSPAMVREISDVPAIMKVQALHWRKRNFSYFLVCFHLHLWINICYFVAFTFFPNLMSKNIKNSHKLSCHVGDVLEV